MRVSTFATTALVATATAQQTEPTENQFEIDIVFPRNETYREAELFPIVYAIQNMTSIRETNAVFRLSWFIGQLNTFEPGEQISDSGYFKISTGEVDENPSLLVHGNNATRWFESPMYNPENRNKWVFLWSLDLINSDEERQCPLRGGNELAERELIFDVKSDTYLNNHKLEDAESLVQRHRHPRHPRVSRVRDPGQCRSE
ncbi:hypothetical protein P885DRAFT_44176 [Corynascus similis CBS 632.67]